jgi:hypothetical protein
MLVADCPYRPLICLAPGIPFTDQQLAGQLAIPIGLWKKTKKKLLLLGKLQQTKVGLALPEWRERPKKNRVVEWDGAAPTKEQMAEGLEERRAICDVWNKLTGYFPDPNNLRFVAMYLARKDEGATFTQMETAVRTFYRIYSQGTPNQVYVMTIVFPFQRRTFWKLVNIDWPAYERMHTTSELIRDLPTPELKQLARDCVKQYSKEIRAYIKKTGGAGVIDVPWKKTVTCHDYLKKKVGVVT